MGKLYVTTSRESLRQGATQATNMKAGECRRTKRNPFVVDERFSERLTNEDSNEGQIVRVDVTPALCAREMGSYPSTGSMGNER